ncbi:Uncharacterised protein [uncultured archaeon]|nr:Uncharacterised protein [uncultured archaeon]
MRVMDEEWAADLARFRREKDSLFKTGPESPMPDAEKHDFAGLKYFPPNRTLIIKAKLVKYGDPEIVEMGTSKGTVQHFHRLGYFEFSVDGKKALLNAYRSAEGGEDETLFVPFRDATSGKESYGSSRYLDLEIRKDDKYALDFNYAYNPYCAYSEQYVCPFAPRENWLKVAIVAGEKKYHG